MSADRSRPPWRLLFVCTANYCRSPLAEGLARHLLAEYPWGGGIAVDSAATHAYRVGEPPDPMAQALALRRGFDLSAKRARLVEPADFDRHELVIAMERGHIAHLNGLCPPARRGRLKLLMDFARGAGEREVPDPFGGDVHDFHYALELIEQGVQGLLGSLAPLVAAQGR